MIEQPRLARFAGIAGRAATAAWALLAGLTAASTILRPDLGTLTLTLSVAAAFLTVAAVLAWRSISVVRVCREDPKTPAKSSLAAAEVVTSLAMFLLGAVLITAVVSRLFGEGRPLFG